MEFKSAVELLRHLLAHAQWYISAIELDHDQDGEQLVLEAQRLTREPERPKRLRASDPALLVCGEWTHPPDRRVQPVLLHGCGKNVMHDYVDTRPVHAVGGIVTGYEAIWSSRCCGVERRWGFTVMRRPA